MAATKNTFLLLIPFFALTLSCLSDASNENRALVNIYLSDAPGDFDQVWLEITGAEVYAQSGNSASTSEWFALDYIPLSNNVNVSSLVAGSQLILGRTELPLGKISQLKLLFGEEHFLIKDEARIPLSFENEQDKEVLVEVDYDLIGGNSYDIFLDIDLAKSIKSDAENPGSFVFTPMVHSFVTGETAQISGKVSPVEAQPFVHAIIGEDTVSTLTDDSGNFLFRNLQAGEYKVYFEPISTYKDSLTNIITTKIDSVSQMETILLSRIKE